MEIYTKGIEIIDQTIYLDKKKLRILIASIFASCLLTAQNSKIIFDTDITGDVDDVLALAMLHTMSDQGKLDLLAVTISNDNALNAPFVDAVNTFYGRPNIPIGVSLNAVKMESGYLALVNEKNEKNEFRYPHDIGVTKKPEKAVPLLRKTLARSEDYSVVIITVGLATNLIQLLETKADQYSNLNGSELISKKVKSLSIMAGSFQTIYNGNRYTEFNVLNDIPGMQGLAMNWPNDVPVIWSGFEIGIAAPYPRESIANDFEYVDHHIVKEAYLLHSGPNHDRPTWDLTSVLYAIYPEKKYFDLSVSGRVTVENDGFTAFTPVWKRINNPRLLKENKTPHNSRDKFLIMNDIQAGRVQEALTRWVSQRPKRRM